MRIVSEWLLLSICFALAQAGESDAARFDFGRDVKPLLAKYCYGCHGVAKQKGGIDLEKYVDQRAIQRGVSQWQEVLRAIEQNEMPPESAKEQPTTAERELMQGWLSYALNNINENDLPKDPGHVVLHRLTRREYNNTIRDLLGVSGSPADVFPEDAGGGGGFENNADTLFIPPIMVEKMLIALAEVFGQAKPERLFTVQPKDDKPRSQQDAAKEILTDFARRAFRHPVPAVEIGRYLKVYDAAVKKEINHQDSLKLAMKSVLMSPNFIYRIENQRPFPAAYEITSYEMAVRLSYFIWASMPDEELFTAAAAGKLQDVAEIERQVLRMLKDPKAQELGASFVPQWLKTDELSRGRKSPDVGKYGKQFTESLRDSMCAEPTEFFNALITKNRSVLDLIDSDYLWVNEELARFYGISGVSGKNFREVPRANKQRGGVMTMASVLTITSHPNRSSPVLRGVWVLEEILNVAPPPPPPEVPALDDKKDGDKKDLTLRQRLEQHRKDPVCASCHSRIDPLGFGLEEYDLMGAWRVKDEFGKAIDASGKLLNGESFQGSEQLRKVLMARKTEIARGLVSRLLSFALGRGLEYYDRPTVNALLKQLEANDYRIQPLLVGIAQSFPFRNKRNKPIAEVTP